MRFCLYLSLMMAFSLSATRSEAWAESNPNRWTYIAYRETTDNVTIPVHWYLRLRSHDVAEIVVKRPGKLFYNRCRVKTRETTHWYMADLTAQGKIAKQTFVHRLSETLHIRQTGQGPDIIRQQTMQKYPWFQPMSWCLASLVPKSAAGPKSNFEATAKTQQTFWLLRPDTLKPFKIRATYQGPDKTLTRTGPPPHHITVRLTGLLSAFWRAHYWFRAEDHLLQRYSGINGGPGTPNTVLMRQDQIDEDAQASISDSPDNPDLPHDLIQWLRTIPSAVNTE